LDRLETIPQPGEQITVEDVRLTVKETSRRKIQSIIAIKIISEETPTSSTMN
jgi:CBS domain containing-hemolysin-like protein